MIECEAFIIIVACVSAETMSFFIVSVIVLLF